MSDWRAQTIFYTRCTSDFAFCETHSFDAQRGHSLRGRHKISERSGESSEVTIVIVRHYDSSMDRLLQGSERVPVVSLYHVLGVQDECPVILINHPKGVCVTPRRGDSKWGPSPSQNHVGG